jgi:hypothetical protein
MNKLYILLAILFLSWYRNGKSYTNKVTDTIAGADLQTLHKICLRRFELQGMHDKADYQQLGDSEIVERAWSGGDNGKEYFSRKILIHTVPEGIKIEVSSDWTNNFAKDLNDGYVGVIKDDFRKVKSGELIL